MIRANFSGSYYDIGFQLGKRIKNLFQIPLISKETIAFTQECLPYVKQYAPGILDEIRGICDAAGFNSTLIEAFILALGKDMIYQAREMFKKGIDFGCSSFAISSRSTGLKTAIFAQNYDWTESFRKFFTVARTRPKRGVSNLAFTDHIVGRYGGMNKEGLALSIHGMPSYEKEWSPGLRMNIIARWILDNFKTTKEAVNYIERIPHICGQTFLLCDKQDTIARMETAGDEIIITYSNNGFMAITNEYETKSLKKYEYKNFSFRNSEERLRKINKWYEANKSGITIGKIKKLLSGHDEGVCNHFEFAGEMTSTIWSWIAQIGLDEILVCDGSPCANPYQRMKF